MVDVSTSSPAFINRINPYSTKYGGFKAFLSDARKEGLIKPVLYGFVIGTGAFDVSSGLGKKLIRHPMNKWVGKPLRRIMGFEKPDKNSFKDKVKDFLQSPEVTFGLSSGAGSALTIASLYGMHRLLQKAPEKDQEKS